VSKKPKKSTKKKVKDRRSGIRTRDAKKIAIMLLVVAVIAAFIAIIIYYNTYYMEKNIVINDLRWFTVRSLSKLLSNLELILYLINSSSTSADVVREVLNQISDNSYTLATAYGLMYKYTGDAKYLKLNTVFTDIDIFATDVGNDEPEIMLARLNQSYETLEELHNMLRRLSIEYNYDLYKAPISDINDMLSLTYKLSSGS